ncbi:MAG: site-specific integrase [Anaerolineales bacterium]|jgi:integrase
MRILNEGQIQLLIITAELKDNPFIQLYQIAISTGMRQEEILGLQWKDIDWERRTIHIRRQLKKLYGGGYDFSTPKTKAGIRKIKVGKHVMDVLKEQRRRVSLMAMEQMKDWQENDLIFPARTGKPLSQRLMTGYFKKTLQAANLPEIRFHDLRHTAASLMLNNGVPVLVVSKRLGHAKPSITLDVYGHLISSMQEQAAEVMDQFIIPLEIPSTSPIAQDKHSSGNSDESHKKKYPHIWVKNEKFHGFPV